MFIISHCILYLLYSYKTITRQILAPRNFFGLQTCLEGIVKDEQEVTVIEYFGSAPSVNVSKLTFPSKNITEYEASRYAPGRGYSAPRWPVGILYAESDQDVVTAVNCAREFGFQISPRGRGHSFQGLSKTTLYYCY